MIVVKNYKSKNAQDVIYDESQVHIKSRAALVLLNAYLIELDVEYIRINKELIDYLNLRHRWLGKFKVLECGYCCKGPLERGERGERDLCRAGINNANPMLATIDHKIPMSEGVLRNDTSNWVVACKKCNSTKGSTSHREFIRSKVHKDFVFRMEGSKWKITTKGEGNWWGVTSMKTNAFISLSTEEIIEYVILNMQ